MGELVVFRPKVVSFRQRVSAGASAEILFFTGVRIVRDLPADSPPKPGRRRPRSQGEAPRKRRKRVS